MGSRCVTDGKQLSHCHYRTVDKASGFRISIWLRWWNQAKGQEVFTEDLDLLRTASILLVHLKAAEGEVVATK